MVYYNFQAPNVHLFAFQSSIYLNEEDEKNCLLWNHCDKVFRKLNLSHDAKTSDIFRLNDYLKIQQDASQSREYLLKNESFALPFEGQINFNNLCSNINGFVSPIKIYDSYGLWLNIRRPEQDENGEVPENPELFKFFNPDNCLLIQENDSFQDGNPSRFLGQIIVITAKLSEDVITRLQDFNSKKKGEELKKIADECVKYFFYTNSVNFNLICNQENLFESHCFEYKFSDKELNESNIVVWLFEKQETDDKFKKSCLELLEIFFYRIKINKAYNDGFKTSKKLEKLLINIENDIEYLASFNNKITKMIELSFFQEKLITLPQYGLAYSKFLFDIDHYENTIAIHKGASIFGRFTISEIIMTKRE